MNESVTATLWTWAPLIITSGALVALMCLRDARGWAALILAGEAWAGWLFSERALPGVASDDYTAYAAVGFGCIDLIAGFLLIMVGYPKLTIVLGIGVLMHSGYAMAEMFEPTGYSYAERLSIYYGQLAYGWVAFALTLLPAFLLIGGGRGGGRRNRNHPHIHDPAAIRRRSLAVSYRRASVDGPRA